MTKDYTSLAMAIPHSERPVPENKTSGIGSFLGLYGGEHIAATEFVIGATFVAWGVSFWEIIIGLLIGNLLATLSYAFLCAPIAVDSRLTLYTLLKKVAGPVIQKIYNVVWGLASIAIASSMLTVAATAIRELVGLPIQNEWYPTNIGFVIIVLCLGALATIIVSKGFKTIAKFSSFGAPWVIAMFIAGGIAAVCMMFENSGTSFSGVSSIIELCKTHVWTGIAPTTGSRLSALHVAAFAWQCNLACHGGLNDMSLFRFAKKKSYGYVSAFGMFVGHFVAWCSAGIMGAAASMAIGMSITELDSGAVAYSVLGISGILCVVLAGLNCANPSIYRASLSLQAVMPKASPKAVTLITGAIATLFACLPVAANSMTITNIVVLIVAPVGAICIAEYFIVPIAGGTRFWSYYRKNKVNYAALIAWLGALIFTLIMRVFDIMHPYLIFLPSYILTIAMYLFFAFRFGANEEYAKLETEELGIRRALDSLPYLGEDSKPESTPTIESTLYKFNAYVSLLAFPIFALAALFGSVPTATLKISFLTFSAIYFSLALAAELKRNRPSRSPADDFLHFQHVFIISQV